MCRTNHMKRIISICVCLVMLFSIYIPAKAVNQDKLEIKFQIGSAKLNINGKAYTAEKPFIKNSLVFVPLIPILEAYGAEINIKAAGKINLVYRDASVDIVVGDKKYSSNEIKKTLSSPPVYVNKVPMVPADFITANFGGKLTADKSKKNYTLLLEDDGAISDFSTIIGSVGKPRIGNSYFGWSISIPKGSQIVTTSFSSKSVSIENASNEFTVDMDVSVSAGRSLEEMVEEIKSTKDEYDSEFPGKVQDVYINNSTSPKSVEILGNIYDKGATIQRIILSGGYEYRLSVSLQSETNGQKIKEKPLLMKLLNSLKLGYKGSEQEVYDISKVNKNNMVSYVDPLYGFSMEVLPEWDNVKNFSYYDAFDSYSLKVGISDKEYIGISPRSVGKIEDMDKFLDGIKAEYETTYNPQYYNFIEKKIVTLQNMKLYKLVYSLKYKDKKYIKEDNFILQGNILFNLELKCPEENYSKNRQKYENMLQTLKYNGKYSDEEMKKLINSRESTKSFSRVGSNDSVTDYEKKDSKWKIKIPGYWLSLPDYDDVSNVFFNEKSQSYVEIEPVKNNSTNRSMEDELKFSSLSSSAEDEEYTKLIEKKTIKEKGADIKSYYYRYENSDDEIYCDVYYYVLENSEYSYCFMYMIPDLYASEKNLKEIKDIWNSFTITSAS